MSAGQQAGPFVVEIWTGRRRQVRHPVATKRRALEIASDAKGEDRSAQVEIRPVSWGYLAEVAYGRRPVSAIPPGKRQQTEILAAAMEALR